MKKTLFYISVIAMCLTLWPTDPVRAMSGSDINGQALKEGDVIRATGDIDIYIVNALGYKRLFVNPAIFNLYGHLSWANVKEVAPSTRDAFVTSGLFRNCETGDQKVYGLDVISEDVANLRWVNTTGAQAVADDPAFFNKVFCINTAEQHLYGTGADYTSVLQVPNYARNSATPTPTPMASTTPSPTPTPMATPTDLPTITSVQTSYPNGIDGTPRAFNVDINLQTPANCYNLTDPSVTSDNVSRVDITIMMVPSMAMQYCDNIPQMFSRSVGIQSVIAWSQPYDIYVNGTLYWSGQVGR